MTEPILVLIGDTADLIADANELILGLAGQYNETGIPDVDVQSWLARSHDFAARLAGNRNAMFTAVGEAIGAASMCWETPEGAGVFQSDRASEIVDDLMYRIDMYGDSLPLVRMPSSLGSAGDITTTLAKAIYEISGQAGGGVAAYEKWETAPPALKAVLIETARQLIEGEVIIPGPALENAAYPQKIVEVPDDPDLREQVAQTMSDLGFPPKVDNPQPEQTEFGGLPPNIRMPPGFHSDSEVRDDR